MSEKTNNSIKNRPYIQEIASSLGLESTDSPFTEVAHPKGTLFLLPQYQNLAPSLQKHDFCEHASLLDGATDFPPEYQYIGEGRRGAYVLPTTEEISVCVKPKIGFPPAKGAPENVQRRAKCPLSEVLFSIKAAAAFNEQSDIFAEQPIGFFESDDGRHWVLYKFETGSQIAHDETVPESLGELVKSARQSLLDSGIVHPDLDSHNDGAHQCIVRDDGSIVVTDFEHAHKSD